MDDKEVVSDECKVSSGGTAQGATHINKDETSSSLRDEAGTVSSSEENPHDTDTPKSEQTMLSEDKGEDMGSETASKKADKDTDIAAENAKLRDQLLRLAADFDNYRKRMIKEKADAIEYANENLLGDLLDPLDNLERTVDAADKAQDPKAIAEGVKMTLGALVKVLGERYGLAAFGAAGEKFNPDLHQAIGRTPAGEGEDVAEPTIKEVYQKGYKLHERVIRHAKVMVITPAEKKE